MNKFGLSVSFFVLISTTIAQGDKKFLAPLDMGYLELYQQNQSLLLNAYKTNYINQNILNILGILIPKKRNRETDKKNDYAAMSSYQRSSILHTVNYLNLRRYVSKYDQSSISDISENEKIEEILKALKKVCDIQLSVCSKNKRDYLTCWKEEREEVIQSAFRDALAAKDSWSDTSSKTTSTGSTIDTPRYNADLYPGFSTPFEKLLKEKLCSPCIKKFYSKVEDISALLYESFDDSVWDQDNEEIYDSIIKITFLVLLPENVFCDACCGNISYDSENFTAPLFQEPCFHALGKNIGTLGNHNHYFFSLQYIREVITECINHVSDYTKNPEPFDLVWDALSPDKTPGDQYGLLIDYIGRWALGEETFIQQLLMIEQRTRNAEIHPPEGNATPSNTEEQNEEEAERYNFVYCFLRWWSECTIKDDWMFLIKNHYSHDITLKDLSQFSPTNLFPPHILTSLDLRTIEKLSNICDAIAPHFADMCRANDYHLLSKLEDVQCYPLLSIWSHSNLLTYGTEKLAPAYTAPKTKAVESLQKPPIQTKRFLEKGKMQEYHKKNKQQKSALLETSSPPTFPPSSITREIIPVGA